MVTNRTPALRDRLACLALVCAIKGNVERSERLRRVMRRLDAWQAAKAASGSPSHVAA